MGKGIKIAQIILNKKTRPTPPGLKIYYKYKGHIIDIINGTEDV